MKLIKGSFHRQKPAKTTNRWVTTSSVSNREMQALVYYSVTDLSLLCQLCSFTPFMPSLNPPFFFFVLSFLGEHSVTRNGIWSIWACHPGSVLPLWGQRTDPKLWFQGWERKPTGFSPVPPSPHSHPKGLKPEVEEAGQEHVLSSDPTWQKGCATQSGVLQLEQLQSRRRKGGCLLW